MGHIEEGGSKLVCVMRGAGEPYLEALDHALDDHLRPWADRMLNRQVRVYRSKAFSLRLKQMDRGETVSAALPVVFAIHDKDGLYWLNTAVAITSLAKYATCKLAVHILHDNSLRVLAARRLAEIADVLGISLSLKRVELPATVTTDRLRQFSAASLYRLMIPKLFPEEDLVVC